MTAAGTRVLADGLPDGWIICPRCEGYRHDLQDGQPCTRCGRAGVVEAEEARENRRVA